MILNFVCFVLLSEILPKFEKLILIFILFGPFCLPKSFQMKNKSSQNPLKVIPKMNKNPSKTSPRRRSSRDLQKSMIFVSFWAPLVAFLGGSGGILGAKSRPSWRPKSIKIDTEIYIKSKVILSSIFFRIWTTFGTQINSI